MQTFECSVIISCVDIMQSCRVLVTNCCCIAAAHKCKCAVYMKGVPRQNYWSCLRKRSKLTNKLETNRAGLNVVLHVTVKLARISPSSFL
jgi:hypothetical protein